MFHVFKKREKSNEYLTFIMCSKISFSGNYNREDSQKIKMLEGIRKFQCSGVSLIKADGLQRKLAAREVKF